MQSINTTEATNDRAVEFDLRVCEFSTGSCRQRAPLGRSADTRPFHICTGGINEKPPHHSWLPSSTFLNATESCILLQPADTAPNISPASSLPFYFSMHAIVPGLFAFVRKPSRLNARDIILPFAGRSVTSVFCSPERAYLPLTSRALHTEGGR